MKLNYRRCISCRQIASKETFWRVVRVHPSYDVCLDSGLGRSAYICRRKDCLEKATIKRRLERSLKVKIPERIYQNLRERLI